MNEKPRILLVEDDAEIRALLSAYLVKNGLSVETAANATAMDRLLASGVMPDLFVLDIMLLGEDGLSICRRLRATSSVPILMLTAKSDDIDRIVGLELGADDYMGKPFNPRELLARIRAILRRQDIRSEASRRLSVGSITIDLDKRAVTTPDGHAIDLTAADFDLLECFVTRPGRVLSRDQLMDWTRGRRADSLDRTIDVQVSRLRKKIETADAPMIKTLRNAGYMLVAEVMPL
jgi:two-component system, OmpR family, response regulator